MTNLSGINLNNGSAVGAKREGMESPSHSLALMPKYEAYKDSQVQWIGDIPANWHLEKAKWLFYKEDRKPLVDDDIVTCFRDGQVTLRKNRRTEGFTNALKEHGYQRICKGDLVIHAMDAFAGAIGVSDSDGKSTPVYAACVPRKKGKVNSYYYAYYMRDLALSGFIVSLAKGIRERSTDFRFNDFAELFLPFPDYEEQTLIANFLDKKTAQIDDAIAIKEQQINLLKERKQIIIQQAVTLGLDPNVPMKDSGVDWIGKIPAHWEVKRIKHAGKIINGYAFPSDAFIQEGARVMKISNIQTMRLDWSDSSYVDALWLNKTNQFRIYKGDLVFALTRPVISTGIKAALVDTDEPILLNQRNAVFRPNDTCDKNWIYFVLLTKGFINDFEMQIDITGQQPNISTVAIGNLSFPLPPELEQKAIVSELSRRCTLLDMAVDDQIAQIEKLKEYKTTLINSAVTGKIKITPEMVEQ